jgi:Ca2+-binding RTX toxin-like protein
MSAQGGNTVSVASSSDSQVVVNLLNAGTVVAQLTLNANGTDSLEVMHRSSDPVFTSIGTNQATAGGPSGSLVVGLSSALDVLVTGTSSSGSASDVNPSSQGWAVKAASGQTIDSGETILFKFVDSATDTVGQGIGDFKFDATGYTSGMSSAEVTVRVYLNAALTSYEDTTVSVTSGQVVQVSQLNWAANGAHGNYTAGDQIYGVSVHSDSVNGGGFRLNGVEAGVETQTAPPDLNFNGVTVAITDGDGDISTQAFNIHLGGATGDHLTTEAIVGTSGSDTLTGTSGSDVLIGGAGNDTLTGGAGNDTFEWRLGDQGTTASPAIDHVTDFGLTTASPAGNDKLDIGDLLHDSSAPASTASDASISAWLTNNHVSIHAGSAADGAGITSASTVIDVVGSGGTGVNQKIVLDNVSMTNLQDATGLSHSATNADLLKAMIEQGKLQVNQH